MQSVPEVDIREIRCLQEVGRGAFGSVVKAEWSGMIVAVKFYQNNHAVEEFWTEVRQLQKHNHPNVIRIFGVCTDRQSGLAYIMEYASGGSLRSRMRSPYTNRQALNWARQCAWGIDYLHGQRIVHRDLKPDNLLLFKGDVLKLGDFGLVATVRSQMSCAGTRQWMAPEVLQCETNFSVKADVYSFGLILYKLYARVMLQFFEGQIPDVENCSQRINDVIQSCCRQRRDQRPTIRYVYDQLMQENF